MRIQEILRALIDIIDAQEELDAEDGKHMVKDMIDNPSRGPLANSPNEIVTDVDAITTLAGGGPNKPKHPDDIRVKDPRGYE
jgi:hypothetical protein